MTRQAYYQYYWQKEETSFEQELVIKEVLRVRKSHKKMGCRKLMVKLEAFMLDHQIKMGRDALFNLLAANQLLIRRRNRRVTTTFSSHWLRKYPNLIREFIAEGINQLWVSDITYWRFENKFLYISFVTDVFSHKIVGYHLSESLEAESSIHALEMALDQLKHPVKGLIHHSDRGIQYCCKEYVKLLQDNGVAISMTENGDPLENALAERINGIIKGEYLDCYEVNSIQEANELLSQVINLYNQERPHMSIGNKTPEEVHQTNQKIDRLWKNYYPKKRTLVNQ
jgi:transposase InsO family protein